MPNIKDQSTVEAIAREYCSNGRNKLEALKTVGYSKSYYSTLGIGKVYSNVRVIEAITAIDDKSRANTEFTVQQAEREYDEVRKAAIAAGQLSAAATAITGKARLYGMDKQTTVTEHVPDQPTGAEADALEQAAREYKISLSKTGS